MTQYGLLLSISSSAYSHGLGQASQFSSNRLCEKKLAVHFFLSSFFFFFFFFPSQITSFNPSCIGSPEVYLQQAALHHTSAWLLVYTEHSCSSLGPGCKLHIFVFLSPSLQIFPASSPCWLLSFPSPTLTSPHTPPFLPVFQQTGQWDLTCHSTCLCRILAIIQCLSVPALIPLSSSLGV